MAESKTGFELGPRGHRPPVPSEPGPAGTGTALSCSRHARALGDEKRPRLVPQVSGSDVRGTPAVKVLGGYRAGVDLLQVHGT